MSALYNLIMDKSTYVWMVRKMNIPTINMCIELNLKKIERLTVQINNGICKLDAKLFDFWMPLKPGQFLPKSFENWMFWRFSYFFTIQILDK